MQPITDRQKKYLKDLMVYHKIQMNFNIDELSKNEASKKIDKILSEKAEFLTRTFLTVMVYFVKEKVGY